jgi:hypothetical protein
MRRFRLFPPLDFARGALSRSGRVAFALAAIAALPAMLAAGQAPSPRPAVAPAARYAPPRTPDGHPDLQGLYDIATLTPVERPAGQPFALTEDQATRLEQQVAARRARGRQPSRSDRTAPPVGGDGSTGAAGGVGGYNGFWIDAGDRYVVIDGMRRTSLVTDPIDGRIPPTTAEARQRNAARATPTSDAAENSGSTGAGAYDNPEQRPLGERCILGFGQTAGPPAFPDYFYNNLHRIVQTPGYVMIETEMIHDARIVRMNQPHVPPTIRKWLGDSVGRWEGDTLVIDTTNFTDKTRFRGSSANLHVEERISRIDDKTLLYQFTVDDPHTWTKPWKGEYTWPATSDLMYEYACTEGNYALGDILRGARLLEKEAAHK